MPTIAIAGLGGIGRDLVRALHAGVPGWRLTAVASGDAAKARAWLAEQGLALPLVESEALAEHAETIVECAPASAFDRIVPPALAAGRTVVVMSAAALLARPALLASEGPGRILLPSGALLGLDAVVAAAEGVISAVTLITRKPPAGMVGAPHLVTHGIEVEGLSAPLQVFRGTAREAAIGFPANVNVAAALALAGIGADRTMVEVWADPTITRNCHRITVEADSARFSMEIEGIPSANPKTGRLTPLSVLASLRKRTARVAVGT